MASSPSDTIVSRLAAEDTVTVPWYKKPNLRSLYLVFLPTCIGVEMTGGIDASMLNALQAMNSWDTFYRSPCSTILGIMLAVYSLGAIIGFPAVPYVNDVLGRRMSIIIGSALMIIGATLQAAAQNFAMFIISRLILGLGIPFAIVAVSSLIGELSHPKERARVKMGTSNMSSNWGWRIPSLLQLMPSLLQVVFISLLPESPRWLISKGRGAEAMAILVKYYAEGDPNSEFVKAEYAQIERTLEMELETRKTSWKDFLWTVGMRKRLLVAAFLGLFGQWSGSGLTSYLLPRILDQIGIDANRNKNLINLVLTCWGLVNATVLSLIATRVKRRTIFLTSSISMFLVFTGWTVATSAQYSQTGSNPSSTAVIALIFIYSPAFNLGYRALIYPYLVELFLFHTRATGIAFYQFFSRSATCSSQFVNPIGVAHAGWKYYICYVVWLAFEVVFVYFVFPETANHTLEELAFREQIRMPEHINRVTQETQHYDIAEVGNDGGTEYEKGSTSYS
ncbi:general substrate transporter [Mycena olivaceomarginata]|nr:general substrate transporter [Mycena olivaceomarginata]